MRILSKAFVRAQVRDRLPYVFGLPGGVSVAEISLAIGVWQRPPGQGNLCHRFWGVGGHTVRGSFGRRDNANAGGGDLLPRQRDGGRK